MFIVAAVMMFLMVWVAYRIGRSVGYDEWKEEKACQNEKQ